MNRFHRLAFAGLVAAVLQGPAARCQEPVVLPQDPQPVGPPAAAQQVAQAAEAPAAAPGGCDGINCYPGGYGAGPDPTRCNKHPSFYSPFRYWTPGAARAYDFVFGPKLSVYAPPPCSGIVAPTFLIQRTRCPAIPPWEMVIQRPMAPETSRARYILGPR